MLEDNTSNSKNQVIDIVERALKLARIMKAEAFARRLEGSLNALRSTCYNIAIVGGIKRGKSTLINTLLGSDNDDFSPIDYEPCTSCIVHYMDISVLPEREEPHAKIFIKDRREPVRENICALRDYICEKNNPDNSKRVERVEVYGNFPLLGACCLVDTPGANAIIERHGELVFQYLSSADAIIMTTMSSQAMTDHDAQMLKAIGKESPERIFYVLTRVDKLRPTERPEVENYVRHEIEKYGFTIPGKIYPVAAKKVHDAMVNHENEATINELRRSWGIQELESELGEFIRNTSKVTDTLQKRMLSALDAVKDFLTKKRGENKELLNNHDFNVEDIEKQRKEVLSKYKASKVAMDRHLRNFSAKWDRETQRMTSRMRTMLVPKLQNAIELALETSGIMRALENAFGLGQLVDKHLAPVLSDFSDQTQERFTKLVEELDEDLGDSVDFFISRKTGGSLLPAVGGVGVLALSGTAIYSGATAASAVLSALGGSVAVSTANVGAIETAWAWLFGSSATTAANGALCTAISGAVAPIFVAIIALKCTGPTIRWITRQFVPGKVENAVEKAVKSMTDQAEAMRDEVIQAFEATLDNAREEKEQALANLEEKLLDWSPEKREQIARQSEEISLLLEHITAAAQAVLAIKD